MANIQVLLLKATENLGAEGELVHVKAGYARNYLLPRKFALPFNQANKKYIEILQTRKAERLGQELEHAEALRAKLKKTRISIPAKIREDNKIYGSIDAKKLIEALKTKGIELETRQLNLYTPAKSIGRHKTKIRLHPEVNFELNWQIVPENPEADAATTMDTPAKAKPAKSKATADARR